MYRKVMGLCLAVFLVWIGMASRRVAELPGALFSTKDAYAFDLNYDAWGRSTTVGGWDVVDYFPYVVCAFSDACFEIPDTNNPSMWNLYRLVELGEPETIDYLKKRGLSEDIIQKLLDFDPIRFSNPDYIKVSRLLNSLENPTPIDHIKFPSCILINRNGVRFYGEIYYNNPDHSYNKTYTPSYGGVFGLRLFREIDTK